MKEEDKSSIPAIMGIGGLVLVVVGTIASFFNIGSFGAILGVLIALYITWIIATMILTSVYPDWSTTNQGVVGFIIALFIIINLVWIGF